MTRRPPLILLVEDDRAVRAMTVRALLAAGFGVLAVESVDQALAALAADAAREVAAVVCDEGLPRVSGRELLAELRRSRPELPTLLVSGHDVADDAAARRFEFMAKPYTGADLAERLRRLLA